MRGSRPAPAAGATPAPGVGEKETKMRPQRPVEVKARRREAGASERHAKGVPEAERPRSRGESKEMRPWWPVKVKA